VIAENINRRNLDPGQRAFVAQDMRAYVDTEAKKRQQEGRMRGALITNEMRWKDEEHRLMPFSASSDAAHPDGPKALLPASEFADGKGSARSVLAKMFNTNNEYIDKARTAGANASFLWRICQGSVLEIPKSVSGNSEYDPTLTPFERGA